MGKSNSAVRHATSEKNTASAAESGSIDLNYRPATYWPAESAEEAELRQLREAAPGRAGHPLGRFKRNYLPDSYAAEVEIARLDLQSTTGDVISIRARRRKRAILYRVVSEYEDELTTSRKSSRLPLTLRQLIKVIDDVRCGDDPLTPTSLREMNVDVGSRSEYAIRSLRSFVEVKSDFYPDLYTWYQEEADTWVEHKLEQRTHQKLLVR